MLLSVVTGSSEGIGRAYAQELASKGLNIILISKGENRLSRAAEEIRKNFEQRVQLVLLDCLQGMKACHSAIFKPLHCTLYNNVVVINLLIKNLYCTS